MKSGRRRSVHSGTAEYYPAIDMRILRRAGLLQPGQSTYDTYDWSNQGLTALSARIIVDLCDPEDASITIHGGGTGSVFIQRLALDVVPCRYGGTRCYFLCPLDGTRCELLYLAGGIFASRKAHGLTYAAKSEDQLTRARRKVRKLARQVAGDARYARPRGPNRWLKVQHLREAQNAAKFAYRERLRIMVSDKL